MIPRSRERGSLRVLLIVVAAIAAVGGLLSEHYQAIGLTLVALVFLIIASILKE